MTSNDHLVAELAASGVLDAGWRAAFEAAPRHRFIPEVIWDDDDQPVRRSDQPQRWLEAAYANAPVVIQLDDGAAPEPGRRRQITSSVSMPRVVAEMLGNVDLTPGMRVLEIGTGAGYNAALLSAFTGAGNVTTVEVDPTLAEQAGNHLAGAGWHPTVVTADGTGGHPPNAPYDRVIATCAVQHVPYRWVTQTRPGGKILIPFGTGYINGAQVLLTAHGDGTATGHVAGSCAFMRLRDQRLPHGWIDDFIHDEGNGQIGWTSVDLTEVYTLGAGLLIGALVPDVRATVGGDTDGGAWTLWLFDHASGDWASVDHEPDATSFRVEQVGTRRLWDEVEDAYQRWISLGEPERERFGLTVTPDGQRVWLDEPDGPSWELPG